MALLVLFGWVIYSWLTGDSGIINQIRLRHDNKNLVEEIDSLNQMIVTLDRERARLRSDTSYLETVIRSELGMAKPGEKVYRLYNGGSRP